MLAAGLLALAGCGSGDKTVDAAALESGIKQDLSSLGVKSVSCPDNVKYSKGVTLDCTVKFDSGASGKVKATNHGGKNYTYSVIPGTVKISGNAVEKSIKDDIAAQGYPDAKVTCPETISVKVGTTATCDVVGAGGNAKGTVTYTFSSASGEVDSSSVKVT